MKKQLLLVCFIFTVFFAKAQDIQVAELSDYNRLMKSTTYVVKIPDPFSVYNNVIEKKMKENWTITPYKIIDWNEFEQKRADKNASFIFVSEAQRIENKKILKYNILNFVMGTPSKDINKMPDLGSVPLSYSNDEFAEEEDTYVYILGGVLMFMQYYANYQLKNPNSKIQDVINKEKAVLHQKELWLIKDDLDNDANSLSKIQKTYNHSVKIVSREDVENAISQKNTNVAYLHLVLPRTTSDKSRSWKFILSAADGKPLYYTYSRTKKGDDGKLSAKDLKKMN